MDGKQKARNENCASFSDRTGGGGGTWGNEEENETLINAGNISSGVSGVFKQKL